MNRKMMSSPSGLDFFMLRFAFLINYVKVAIRSKGTMPNNRKNCCQITE